MAASNLFVLIDDIATLLDDVATMTKVAAGKTSGVLGDDLALNAQQVSGVRADRELPVVWAVAKGSLLNKCILVPAALIISVFIPWAIIPLLMVGGAYLCFEGVEKIAHTFFHKEENNSKHAQLVEALNKDDVDIVGFEKDKIKGAIRTDFILSAEIIVISLGVVAAAPLIEQALVLAFIAVVITAGVYGIVAGIVKIDDAGLYLSKKVGFDYISRAQRKLGVFLIVIAPYLMKILSVVGTAAMFMVGGGILVHGWPWVHHLSDALTSGVLSGILNQLVSADSSTWVVGLAGFVKFIVPTLFAVVIGCFAGLIILAGVHVFSKVKG